MRHDHVRCRRFKDLVVNLCVTCKKCQRFLQNGNVCRLSSLQTKVLREKKSKGKSLHETGVSNWRLQ